MAFLMVYADGELALELRSIIIRALPILIGRPGEDNVRIRILNVLKSTSMLQPKSILKELAKVVKDSDLSFYDKLEMI